MSTPKRQHTVPKVYLSNFVDTDGRLSLFSKRRSEHFRPEPKDALIRKFYYSQPIDGVDNKAHNFETELLGEIETKYPSLYEALLDGQTVDLETLFLTVLSMRVRSVGFREPFEIALADFVDHNLDKLLKINFPAALTKAGISRRDLQVTIDPHRSLQAMSHYLLNYCKAITTSHFKLVKPNGKKKFLTSDNPVVWFERTNGGEIKTPYTSNPTKKTIVFFPLNPYLGLLGTPTSNQNELVALEEEKLSRSETNELNAAILACAWDHVVGHCTLPKLKRQSVENVAPEMKVSSYSPDNGSFELASITLSGFRTKAKYVPPERT